MIRRTALTSAAAALLTTALTTGAAGITSPATAYAAPHCGTVAEPQLRVEHTRLDDPVVTDLLARSGFDRTGTALRASLCAADSSREAIGAARAAGRALWARAVDVAQGRVDAGGLPASDDRPLYWARLLGQAEIAAVEPGFPSWSEDARAKVLRAFETASRGVDTTAFAATEHRDQRVLVSGFDPFTLDRNIRQSNPSGASALAMDGRVLETADGPVEIQAVVFPVLWDPFAEGIVERAFMPHLIPGKRDVDTAITISQGRAGKFDLEYWNGANRGGFGDNDRISRTGMIPIPSEVPHEEQQPQWTRTSLPTEAMQSSVSGAFPININHVITEIPAGGTAPVTREDPTPGSTAVSGAGGDYLSNESAYRTTALRDALGIRTKQGHIHVPVLSGDASGEPLPDMRGDIVAETIDLVVAAATN